MTGKILYISGTDTGVGKTVVACALTRRLREAGVKVMACKPFCSGSRSDIAMLHAAQRHPGPMEDLNAFYFDRPVSPYQAAEERGEAVSRDAAVSWVRARAAGCEWLVVEGAGGVLSPLGPGYTNLELMRELGGFCVLVCRNRLGVLHQALSSFRILKSENIPVGVVLNEPENRDETSAQNNAILRRFQPEMGDAMEFPYLAGNTGDWASFEKNYKKLKKTIAWERIGDTLSASLRERLAAIA